METSLYIHIPFCERKCTYCDFYSIIYNDGIAASYIDVLSKQIEGLSRKFSTIYIGGGTPTVLGEGLLKKILSCLRNCITGSCEFTIEANPESLGVEKIKLFLDMGVSRLSIGVQSLRGEKLKKLGRLHTSRRALDAVYLASKKGFKNINIDMIFGVWCESPETWEKELREAARLPITHVSCYSLTYEKGTPLFLAVKNRSITPLEDTTMAQMYKTAIETLSIGGFKQYEVSNFSKEGYECRHNLNYWENNPYIGLGPSAVSYIDGSRIRNVSDVSEYIKNYTCGKSLTEFTERLSPLKKAKETAAIKIRTKDGIDFDWFRRKCGYDFLKLEERVVSELVKKGFIKYKKYGNIPTGVMLRQKGFLFCDTVSSAFL